ncbi:MAG: AP2 domain-containing protein [Chloroflexota bacterium]
MRIQCSRSSCGKVFNRQPSWIKERNYCSRRCAFPVVPPILSNDGLTASIPLHTRAGSIRAYAVVDAADAEWASQWRWSLDSDGYAVRSTYDHGRRRLLKLHRALLGLIHGDDTEGDHIDRDRLNDRRNNLRATTREGNGQNVSSFSGSTSEFRGVSWENGRQKWRADIKANGRSKNLGYFDTESEAAEAARLARARLMPFAVD